ncbi:MAG: erythromycin esterase family protein [Sphingobacteriaceae bacterium]|nr:MAG: erythromycin esterase family protein [Sphingobacteriaceae bacterium]
MKLNLIAAFLIFLLKGNTCFGQQDNVLAYLKTNAVSIDTHADSLQGLSALNEVFKDRRIIGMGEATHGTQEFQADKFLFFKYLVTQLNYKLFGIEANFTECREVNDYVFYGKGDAKTAIDGMYFWTWNTTEVLKMVEWMRSYNTNKPDNQKIKFYGFDMQYDVCAIQQVTQKLKKLDSVYFNANYSQLAHVDTVKGLYSPSVKMRRDSLLSTLIVPLKTYVNSQENNLLKIYSKEEVAYTKQDIRLLEQYLDENWSAEKNLKVSRLASKKRDKYMAENIEWILEHEGPESKMMLWAHNYHVSKNEGINTNKTMGSYLKKLYKDQYYVIGFDFNKGSFRAVDAQTRKLKNFTVSEAKANSSGLFFAGLNMPEFFIDIEKAVKTNSPAKKFFARKIAQRSLGSTFNTDWKNGSYIIDPLYDYYDGLIFVNETTATMPLK